MIARTLFLALGCMALFSQNINAQATEQKYIEVTVTDSVVVVPDVVEYLITLKRDYSDMEMPVYDDNTDNTDYMNELNRMEEEAKMKMEIQAKKLKEHLTKSKVNFKENKSRNEGYGETSSYDMTSYTLTFKSTAELTAFIDKMPDDIEYNGNLTSMRCSNPAKFEDKLLEKIITRAKTQAVKIAALSSVKLGGMIQYSDNINEITKGIQESILSLMREAKRRYDDMYHFENLVLTKTVRIRYAVE